MPPLFTSTVFRPSNKPPRPGKWWLDRTRRHDLMIRYATIATKEISKFYLNGQVLQTVSSLSMRRHRLKADRCGKCTVSLLNFAVNSSKRATDPLCTKPVISFHPFSSHFVWFDHFLWIEFAFDRSKGGRPWSTHAHKIGKRSETKNYVLPYVGRKIKEYRNAVPVLMRALPLWRLIALRIAKAKRSCPITWDEFYFAYYLLICENLSNF